jgi:hypothetical protein
MSDTIIISVDGENGSTAAQDDAFDPAVFEVRVPSVMSSDRSEFETDEMNSFADPS